MVFGFGGMNFWPSDWKLVLLFGDKTSDFPGGLALEEDTASCRDKL